MTPAYRDTLIEYTGLSKVYEDLDRNETTLRALIANRLEKLRLIVTNKIYAKEWPR